MNENSGEFVTGLRAMADWYEKHPDMPRPSDFMTGSFNGATEDRPLLRRIARAMGTFDKGESGDLLTLSKKFGPIKLRVLFFRHLVCQRRVVKTETVTETIVDPEAPLVEHTFERETVEWDCPPLLAEEAA